MATRGLRSRGDSVESTYPARVETPGSPRRTHSSGRNDERLEVQGLNARHHKPAKAKKQKRRRPRATTKATKRDPVNEGVVETKLKLRDMCQEANARVDKAMLAFEAVMEGDSHKLKGRYAGSGTSYEVLSEIKTQTTQLVLTLDKLGWQRDEVIDDLNMWIGGMAGEASVVDAELRGELLESKERTLDLVKDSSLDFKEREEKLLETTEHLNGIFGRTVDTAAGAIREGAKKYARVAVARERAKMLASKCAINEALRGGSAVGAKRQKGDGNADGGTGEEVGEVTENELDAIVADPDSDVVRLIEKWREEVSRAKKAENMIRKYELAKFAADDKLARSMSDWEDKRDLLNKHIKESRDELRLTERKLKREKQRAKEREVRTRNQKETESFVEKNSKRKGTEMLKMQLTTLKNRVSELEKQVEESENAYSELELEVSDLHEQLEGTKTMVKREEYEDIKRQLFEASDQIDIARKETAVAQQEAEDAREETAQAQLEKAKVLEKLDLARREIQDLNGEVGELKQKLVDAEDEKKRALAEQQAKHEVELAEEKEKTKMAEERAAAAEAIVDQLKERIEELEQEIEDIKAAHRLAMEELREEHERAMDELREQHAEEIRVMQEEFEREKKILEDKIALAIEQIEQIREGSSEVLEECLRSLSAHVVPLSEFAVNAYGRRQQVRFGRRDGYLVVGR